MTPLHPIAQHAQDRQRFDQLVARVRALAADPANRADAPWLAALLPLGLGLFLAIAAVLP